MKGKITIEANEEIIHCEGEMLFHHEKDPFEVIRSLATSLGINTPQKWAELVDYALPRLKIGRLNQTIITIPQPPTDT